MSTELGSLIYTLMLNDAGFEGQVVAAKGSFAEVGVSATKSAEEVSLAQDKQIAAMGKGKAASEEMHASTSNVGSSMNQMAVGAAAVAVGIGFVADKTVKAASDYQESLTGLVTGAGESQANIGLISKGLLDMSEQTGTTTQQLTSGMFMIESAGFHGAAGLNVLQAAAEGAKVGQADLGTVADATTTIMKDYGGTLPTQAVNELVATVANGKTHMQDLAMSLSQVLPTSSAAKVGLNDVMGAMATMTGEGVPAANAATYLRQTIIGLSAPGSAATKALKDVGLSASDVAKDMQKSLPDTLKMITDAVGKKFPEGSSQYIQAMKAISGGSKTMQGMLDLTGGHMKDFQTNVGNVTDTVQKGGKQVEGWNEVQKDFSFKMAQAKADISAAGIALGTALMPALTLAAKAAADFLKPIAEWVTKNQAIAAGVMIVVAVLATLVVSIVLIAKTVKMVGDAWDIVNGIMDSKLVKAIVKAISQVATYVATHIAGAAAAAAGWIATNAIMIAGIALVVIVVVAAVVLIMTHWKQISKFFVDLWKGIVDVFQTVMGAIGKAISTAFNAVVDFFKKWGMTILAIIFLPFSIVLGLIIMFWKPITAFFQSIWDGIKAAFAPVIGFFVGLFQREVQGFEIIWGAVVSFFQAVWNGIVAVFTPVINFYVGIYKAAWDGIVAVWNAAVGFFTGVWNNIVTVFTPIVNWFGSIFRGAWNGIVSAFGAVGGFFRGIWNDIVSIFTNVGTSVGNAVGGAFKNVVNGVISGAVSIINGFIGAIDTAIDVVNNIPGVHIGKLQSLGVPRFATGTDNYPGGWGIMNEQGGELVKLPNGSQIIPADKTNQMLGSSKQVTYNFGQGSVVLSTADAVGAFFNIGNRNTQLEGQGIAPLAGTTRV